jgi:hypothetical protein
MTERDRLVSGTGLVTSASINSFTATLARLQEALDARSVTLFATLAAALP